MKKFLKYAVAVLSELVVYAGAFAVLVLAGYLIVVLERFSAQVG